MKHTKVDTNIRFLAWDSRLFPIQNVRKQILRDYNAKLSAENSEPRGTTQACPVLGTALAKHGSIISIKEPIMLQRHFPALPLLYGNMTKRRMLRNITVTTEQNSITNENIYIYISAEYELQTPSHITVLAGQTENNDAVVYRSHAFSVQK